MVQWKKTMVQWKNIWYYTENYHFDLLYMEKTMILCTTNYATIVNYS